MREWNLDLPSLYPEVKTESPYTYTLLVDELSAGDVAIESYGVSVTDRRTGEHSDIHHLTVSIPRIDAFLEKLVRNQVGPLHLQDVAEDWI